MDLEFAMRSRRAVRNFTGAPVAPIIVGEPAAVPPPVPRKPPRIAWIDP